MFLGIFTLLAWMLVLASLVRQSEKSAVQVCIVPPSNDSGQSSIGS